MFLAPYSFNMAAVEKLFSFIKNRDLNPLATRAYSRYAIFEITILPIETTLEPTSKSLPYTCAGLTSNG